MKIGMYKPYKKIFFTVTNEDLGGWSNEAVQLTRLLQDRGHTIVWLSPTSLLDIPIKVRADIWPNVFQGDLKEGNQCYDRVFVLSGRFDKEGYESINDLIILQGWNCQIDFLHMDIDLVPPFGLHQKFDNWYAQASPELLSSKSVSLSALDITHVKFYTLPVYGVELDRGDSISRVKEKWRLRGDSGFLYGGSERDRLGLFLDYVYRPGFEWYGDIPSLRIDNRISQHEYLAKLNAATWSIVYTNHSASKVDHLTPKPWENLVAGVLSFVDIGYDLGRTLIAKEVDWKVGCFAEVLLKLGQIRCRVNPEKDNGSPGHNWDLGTVLNHYHGLVDAPEDVVAFWYGEQWDLWYKPEYVNGEAIAEVLQV